MKLNIILIAVSICFICHTAHSSGKIKINRYLKASQNESNILDDINLYMTHYEGIHGKKNKGQNGPFLTYNYPLPGAPESTFIVRIEPQFNNKGTIKNSFILIEMYYELPLLFKSEKMKAKLNLINNSYMSKYNNPNQIFILSKYLVFRDCICIPNDVQIPIKTIYATLSASSYSWTKYYKILQKNFDMPKEKIVPPFQEEKKTVKSKKMDYPPSLRHLVE